MKVEIIELNSLAKMSDSEINGYIEWLEDQRRTADFKIDALEIASEFLSDELRRRDW